MQLICFIVDQLLGKYEKEEKHLLKYLVSSALVNQFCCHKIDRLYRTVITRSNND